MLFTQVRHATCIIYFGGTRFLVDPILYKKNTLDPVAGSPDVKNPLVDILVPDADIKNIDAILLTHVHRDHFDPSIIDAFGKDIPIVCCNEYEKQLSDVGFTNLTLIKTDLEFRNIHVTLVKGQHGIGEVGKLMGNSYGFVLNNKNNETLYVAGDTIWCSCVEDALATYMPQYIVVFAGSAMINNEHVTMDENDVSQILKKLPNSKVIAIHMEAWNHCRLTRSELRSAIDNNNLYLPKDGETIEVLV